MKYAENYKSNPNWITAIVRRVSYVTVAGLTDRQTEPAYSVIAQLLWRKANGHHSLKKEGPARSQY